METPPRPYHHGNLREALLRAAEDELEKNGAQSLSLRELSRDLGVSHTSPRRHFAGKQALLDALAQSGFERLGGAMERAVSNRGQDFDVRLKKLGRAYVGFATKHPALLGLMFEAKHRADAPRELLESSYRAFSHLPAIFKEGQEKGEVIAGDPACLSLVVGASLQGLVAISVDGKFKGFPLDKLANGIVETIILGVRPRA